MRQAGERAKIERENRKLNKKKGREWYQIRNQNSSGQLCVAIPAFLRKGKGRLRKGDEVRFKLVDKNKIIMEIKRKKRFKDLFSF